MKRNALLWGTILFAAGIAVRFLPVAADLLSLLGTASLAAGFALLLAGAWRRRRRVRDFVRGSPVGRHLLAVGVLVLLIAGAWVVREVLSEASVWKRAGPIKEDLGSDDPRAALDLAVHLTAEAKHHAGQRGSAVLRERIARRLADLGQGAPEVTRALRESLLGDPASGVRQAAALAWSRVAPAREVLAAILDLPRMEGEAQARMEAALGLRGGPGEGASPEVWLSWVLQTWAGAGAEESFAMAVTAARALSTRPEARALCLARVRDGGGADRPGLETLLGDAEADFRTAAAEAAGKRGEPGWVSMLGAALKVEKEVPAARAMAAAMSRLAPSESLPLFLEAVRGARYPAGKSAASERLSAALGMDATADPAMLLGAVYRKLLPGAEKKAILDELCRLVRDSEAARQEVSAILRDPGEKGPSRSRALKGFLDGRPDLLKNEDLVALLADEPDQDFAQTVRAELRRRTGRDGGIDPAVWRQILGQ